MLHTYTRTSTEKKLFYTLLLFFFCGKTKSKLQKKADQTLKCSGKTLDDDDDVVNANALDKSSNNMYHVVMTIAMNKLTINDGNQLQNKKYHQQQQINKVNKIIKTIKKKKIVC